MRSSRHWTIAPHGQGAFANAADHLVASGLDALGEFDLALARQQLDRAHLAEIHAHRVVGALGHLLARAGRELGRGGLTDLGAGLLRVVGLDHVDAHLGQHHHGILDLLGGHAVGGQRLVQLVVSDVAALLGRRQHPLDALVVASRSGLSAASSRDSSVSAAFEV